MILTRRNIIGLLALSSAFFAVPAMAAPQVETMASQPVDAPYVQYAQSVISPSKAKSIAARAVPGAKFVDITRSGDQYRVRMLRKDGQVVDVLIDATTGRVLN